MSWTIFFFFLALFLLVVSHEAGHFFVARAFGVRVLRFSFGFGKVLLRMCDKKGTEYTWSLIPLGGYVKMLDETIADVPVELRPYAFNRKPVWVRFLIVLAGPLFNFLFAWIVIALVLMIGVITPPSLPIIDTIEPGTPAYVAGLMHGDKILKMNAEVITTGAGVAQYIQQHPDELITIQFKRHRVLNDIKLKLSHIESQGRIQGWLGVRLLVANPSTTASYIHRENPLLAFKTAGLKTWDLTLATFSFVGNMFHGHLAMQSVSGPLGIAQYAGISAHAGLVHYLLFLALLSVSLGVLNLLPIPMLDGGYLFYYLIEMITRRPISVRMQSIAAYLGFLVLIAITVIAFKNDLTRLGIGT